VYRFGPPTVVVGVPHIGRQLDHDAFFRRWMQDEVGTGVRRTSRPVIEAERHGPTRFGMVNCVTLWAIYEQASPRKIFATLSIALIKLDTEAKDFR
jgi:hypothetical protein